MVRDVVKMIRQGAESQGRPHGSVSALSHMLVFAAEQSRTTGQTVAFSDYVSGIREQAVSMEKANEVS